MEWGGTLSEPRISPACVGRSWLFKDPSTTSITDCLMESRCAGQGELLMEAGGEPNAAEGVGGNSGARLRCVAALAATLALALAAATVALGVYLLTPAPPCDPGMSSPDQVREMPSKLRLFPDQRFIISVLKLSACPPSAGSDGGGTYDIFTVNETAEYLIYGWLRFPGAPNGDVILSQTDRGQQRNLSTKTVTEAAVWFFQNVKMAKGSKVVVTLQVAYTAGLFHMVQV